MQDDSSGTVLVDQCWLFVAVAISLVEGCTDTILVQDPALAIVKVDHASVNIPSADVHRDIFPALVRGKHEIHITEWVAQGVHK